MTTTLTLQPQTLNLDGLVSLLSDIGFDFEDHLWELSSSNLHPYTTAEVVRPIEIVVGAPRIGFFTSAGEGGEKSEKLIAPGKQGAEQVAKAAVHFPDNIWVTGACPIWANTNHFAYHLKQGDPTIPIVGINPFSNPQEAARYTEGWEQVKRLHDIIIYSAHKNFLFRDVLNSLFVRGAVSVRGSAGSHHENAILYESGRVAGHLIGYGGVIDQQKHVVKAMYEDGKNHFVVIESDDADALVNRVTAQIEVDNALRNHSNRLSVLDLYDRVSRGTGELEPVVNGYKVQRNPNSNWQVTPDRRLAFEHYNRRDWEEAGKILVRLPRDEAIGHLREMLGDYVVEVPILRDLQAQRDLGFRVDEDELRETGRLLFPAKPDYGPKIKSKMQEFATKPDVVYSSMRTT